jgi:hypothetical protein
MARVVKSTQISDAVGAVVGSEVTDRVENAHTALALSAGSPPLVGVRLDHAQTALATSLGVLIQE